MIFNKTEYNPFPAIIKYMADKNKAYSLADMDYIRKELFKAGVVPESDDEFDQTLNLLAEMDII